MPKLQTPALTSVKVNNEEIKYSVNTLELRQYIDRHHELTVTCRQDVVGEERIDDPEPYSAFLGKPISVNIVPQGGKVDPSYSLDFIGVVTEVKFENSIDAVNILVISAKSPTISMDGAKRNAFSFDQSAGDIIGSILRKHPITLGTIDSTEGTLRYSVQYRETDYEYIMRLAHGAGKFAFYDGKEFRLVSASSADEQELKWRENLGSFSFGLGTASAEFTAQIYNYEQDKSFDQDTSSVASQTSLSAMSKKAPDASKEIFKDSGFSQAPTLVSDAQELDAILNRERSRSMGEMIKCAGHSIVPKVAVGHCAKITGMDSFNQQFWVTEVSHFVDQTGKYHNDFICIPLDIAYPGKVRAPQPHTQVQSAVVTDNQDPDQLGRIQVKFPWNPDNTIWIRFMTPHAGKDRGWYALPEIGDEVLVAFEAGDPAHPIALGALYNKGQTPHGDTQASDNTVKMFKTKSGNQIVFKDESGGEKIEISQGDGKNMLVLDLSGPSISFESSGGDLTFKGNNITIESDSSITMKAGSSMELKSDGTMAVEAAGNQNIKGAMVKIEGNPINLN